MLSRAIQCMQAPYTSILTKVGKGHHVYVRVPNGYRRNWLLSACAYSTRQQENMRLTKSMRLTGSMRLIKSAKTR